MIIYKFTNKINGKIYIGQTIKPLNYRIRQHKNANRSIFSKAIKKHGFENFEIEIITTASTIEELNELEIYWISYYGCLVPNGYNMCNGGGGTKGYKHKVESIKAMEISSVKRKVINTTTGEKFNSLKEAAEKYDLHRSLIGHVCYGRHNTCGGFEWEFDTYSEEERKKREKLKSLRSTIKKPRSKIINSKGETFDTIKNAEKKYNLTHGCISRVLRGVQKTAANLKWQRLL